MGTIPPAYVDIDEHGVSAADGSFNFSMAEGSIGEGDGTIALNRYWGASGWTDNWSGTLFKKAISGSTHIYLVFGSVAEHFVLTSGTYVNQQANGTTLTANMDQSIYTYTARDGTIYTYTLPYDPFVISVTIYQSGGCNTLTTGITACALPTQIVSPSGLKTTLQWDTIVQCTDDECRRIKLAYRLQSVSNTRGYRMGLAYVSNAGGVPPGGDWYKRQTVTFGNGASTSGPTPAISYAYPSSSQISITDPAGRAWRFTTGAGGLTGIKRPSSSTDNPTLTYGANGVTAINDGVTSWTYSRTVSGSTATSVMTDALGQTRTTVADLTIGRPTSITDALSHSTGFTYDANGRRTRVTMPEGNYVETVYDGRGNATSVTQVAKAGSGLANIVTSASFDASCANAKTCNQPNTTTDARGKVTDYTYDATHGGVLTVTSPAPTTGATRPQTRYSYSAQSAWIFTSPMTAAASPAMYRLTGISQCATFTSCAGGGDEVKSVIGYQAGSSSTGTNLLPVSVSSGSGDGTLTATTSFAYDLIGNRTTVDGPLSGTADTTRYIYDAARQAVGAIGPDPDGAGSRKNGAARTTFNPDGQPTLIEQGNTNGQTDSDWAAFAASQSASTTYDVAGRKTKETVDASGTTHAVTQMSYDADNRPTCTTVRMNPAVFASLPADACTASTLDATYGPDRIVKNSYDAAGRVTKVQTAFGTAEQADEATTTYSANGQVATVKDGEANLTTYEYDGHDRLLKTRYPSPTQGAGTSSATDYEQLTYDAGSNVTQLRLRDAQTIGFAYDNLDRLVTKDLPSPENDATYGYDLLGRITSAAQNGQTLTFGFDALSRQSSAGGPLGTVSYQYDAAGRRTRMTWPDAFYVTYDYDVAGNPSAIRENGAASGIGVLASYAYDDLGRRTGITRGNGTTSSTGYDGVSRLTSLVHDLSGTAADLTVNGIAYNPASQLRTLTRSNDAYAWAGHYNEDRSATLNGLNQQSAAANATTATNVAFTHDARGNISGIGASAYGYSVENLLLTAPSSTTFAYDPALRLYQSVGGGVTTRFQYDGADMIGEYNASNTLQRRYVHGPGSDEPLVWYEGSGTSDRRWLHADERGSVIAVSNASGASLAINSYDPYGRPATGNLGRYGYTGQTWLPEIGMWHYKARIYNPAANVGRFMQSDPIGYGSGMNMYAYVAGDPVNLVDPSGLEGESQPTEGPPIDVCGGIRLGDQCVSRTYFELLRMFSEGLGASPRPPSLPKTNCGRAPYINICGGAGKPEPKREPDCGTPPASQTYPVPKGYETADPGKNRFIRPIGTPITKAPITNPAYQRAFDAAKGIDYKGAAKDLGKISAQVFLTMARGPIGGSDLNIFGPSASDILRSGGIVGSASAKEIYSLTGNKCSR